MVAHTGKFKDPVSPTSRLYGEVLSTHNNLHFVKVTRRNAKTIEAFNAVVPITEFITDSGANQGYWRRQLRGNDGQWIEMGGGIEWTDPNGDRHIGTVTGFDDEIERVIVRDTDGDEYKLSADEIKSSAVKAVLPDGDDDDDDSPFGGEEPLDLTEIDELLMEADGQEVTLQEWANFPVGGPPLEIKDQQGNPLGTIHKQPNPDSPQGYDLILALLRAIIPSSLWHIFRAMGTNKKK